jgi:uncharacterized membrane protein
MAKTHEKKYTRESAVGYFKPESWEFWRVVIACFCIFAMVGHWLEIPYCMIMDWLFGIVTDEYAIWHDPLWVPYWVYGIGAVAMTLVIEPWKERLVEHTKTLPRALAINYVVTVALAALLEWGIGVIINQPDETGTYPYWDNSHLPLNIGGQAWLVNDIVIGAMAMLYLWVFYPLIYRGFRHLSEKAANIVFAAIIIAFGICCALSYIPGLV